jgi:glycosyltransferase involved in cell wall biosynthesis
VHLCSIRPFFPEDPVDELPGHVIRHSLGVEGARGLPLRLRIVRQLDRLIREVQPEVLHVHQGLHWYTLPARLRGSIPELLDIHDAPSRMKSSPLGMRLAGAVVRRLPYTVVVHSRAVQAEVTAEWGVSPSRIEVLPLGIDTAALRDPPVDRRGWRRANGVPEGAPVVVNVARLVRSKNLDLFLEVASRVAPHLPEALFLLVGGGPDEERLRGEAARLGVADRVRFLGVRGDVVEILRSSDLFLSTSDYEGFGLAILEASAAGLPVVSTRVGGVEEVVEAGETALLVPPGSAGAAASAVLELLLDPERRLRMGAAGRLRARERFDAVQMARGYEALYTRLGRDGRGG